MCTEGSAHHERAFEGGVLLGRARKLEERGEAARDTQHSVSEEQKRRAADRRAHSQKKALMCVCALSARRTAATRLPEGSGSPGEFPKQWEAVACHGSSGTWYTTKGRVAERTAIRQRADAAVALPKKRDRLFWREQRRGRGEGLEVLPTLNAIPIRQREKPL